jgi:hypothetical protein
MFHVKRIILTPLTHNLEFFQECSSQIPAFIDGSSGTPSGGIPARQMRERKMINIGF